MRDLGQYALGELLSTMSCGINHYLRGLRGALATSCLRALISRRLSFLLDLFHITSTSRSSGESRCWQVCHIKICILQLPFSVCQCGLQQEPPLSLSSCVQLNTISVVLSLLELLQLVCIKCRLSQVQSCPSDIDAARPRRCI